MHEPVVNRTNLDAVNMVCLQVDVPLVREVHGRRIRLLAFNKTDADNVPVRVLQEESDPLEPASVPGPTACARHTSGELLRAVTV